ncbi:hypothetical protein Dimus_025578 [Dionaea muscipula]
MSDKVKLQQLDQEITEMVSALDSRLTTDLQQVQKLSSSSIGNDDEADADHENGTRSIITIAGTNVGATMKGTELQDGIGRESPDHLQDEPGGVTSTYVNSNFQAVNNSIMLGGSSYTSNDPGVQVEISDHVDVANQEKKNNTWSKRKEKTAASSTPQSMNP